MVWLATGSYDMSVRIWDVESGTIVNRLEGHTGPVRSLAWSPSGRLLASGSDDGTVRIWDLQLETGNEMKQLDLSVGKGDMPGNIS